MEEKEGYGLLVDKPGFAPALLDFEEDQRGG